MLALSKRWRGFDQDSNQQYWYEPTSLLVYIQNMDLIIPLILINQNILQFNLKIYPKKLIDSEIAK